MIAVTLILLSAICKAVADTLSHHFATSVFRNRDPKRWDPNVSWQYVKFLPLTKYRPDPWHLANSGMIVFSVAAAVLHAHVDGLHLHWALEIVAGGLTWIGAFNLFYDYILRRK